MKKIYTYLSVVALALMLNAQAANAQVFEKGTKLLSLGLGVGSSYGGSGFKTSIPPLQLAFDMGITDKIGPGYFGIGAIVGYSAYSYEFGGFFGSPAYKWTYSNLIIGARGTYHFDLDIEKLDLYGGVLLGYNVASVSTDAPSGGVFAYSAASYGGVVLGGFAGARYMFTDKFGAYLELGNAVSYLNLGLTVKF